MTERLNLVFGFNWDFEVTDKQILDDEVIVAKPVLRRNRLWRARRMFPIGKPVSVVLVSKDASRGLTFSMSRVAERSGLERTHLYRKLKQLGVGLAIVLLIYRNRTSVDLDDVDLMKG